MILSEAEFHEAATLEQASELMARWGAESRFLAGGTDLLVDLKTDRYRVGHVISLNRIAALRGISPANGGVRIKALTTINELAASAIIRERFPAILDATREMATPQIRNLATVGGNIASAVPCADLPPILAVLHASLSLWSSSGERVLPLEDFFIGPRQTVRRGGEILSEIFVPYPPPRFGAAYARFGLREANAVAVAGVAAGLLLGKDGRVVEARICLSAVAPTPKLVTAAESLLVGKVLDRASLDRVAAAAMDASQPISDLRATADFRRELVGILTRRALVTAQERAAGGKQ